MTKNDSPDLQAPPELSLPEISAHQKLITLLEFMKMSFSLDQKSQDAAINIFMEWLCQLYLDYFQYHLDEAKEIGKNYESVLLSLIDPIKVVHVEEFMERMFRVVGDEWGDPLWEEGCLVKTKLEVFHEMFSSITGYITGYSVDELNEYLEVESYQSLGGRDKIPKNMPKHHWWWFMIFGQRWDKDEGLVER